MTDHTGGGSEAPSVSNPSAPGPETADRAGEGPHGEPSANKRRRGSRGGRARAKPTDAALTDDHLPDLPDPPGEGVPRHAAPQSAPSRPKIGDTRPAPATSINEPAGSADSASATAADAVKKRNPRGGKARGGGNSGASTDQTPIERKSTERKPAEQKSASQKAGGERRQGGGVGKAIKPVRLIVEGAVELDEETLAQRRGRERKGRPVGRYLMAVHGGHGRTQIAVLEGRSLLEHYISKPTDDVSEIHGNIYLGRVQNVLPGMEAAFVDIATPKNAVLYAGDVSVDVDADDVVAPKGPKPRIEQMLKPRQMIVCQVTKNPIGAKGARLTQEVSLPGRFVVLIPNSKTYGISKRLADPERKRLRAILDHVKPAQHGVIVRTAAENVVEEELRADVTRLVRQWEQIEALAKSAKGPSLLYREPDMAVRVIREEFNSEYRSVVIDDRDLFVEVRDYVAAISPALADRVEFYDAAAEGLPLYERHHIHEQLHKALDRKVWLPSGGSLIIEHTEALTVIDVNTGKNVGSTSLEATVLHNNLEAAEEIARQLRLRDIGGIIVIDFIDMEIKENRLKVVTSFRTALARDKTRTQVFDISELGLIEMTRKRIGEGLITSYADPCPECAGRGIIVDYQLLA